MKKAARFSEQHQKSVRVFSDARQDRIKNGPKRAEIFSSSDYRDQKCANLPGNHRAGRAI
jgi:hypothetical protein